MSVTAKGVDYELFIPENSLLMFDIDHDNKITERELTDKHSEMTRYVTDRLRLEQDMEPMTVTMKSIHLDEKDTIPGVSFSLNYDAFKPIQRFIIDYNLLFDDADPAHLNFVLITEGDDIDQAVLDSAHRSYHYESFHPATPGTVLWNFFMLGVEHILTGYDHLLFLFSQLLIAVRTAEIVKIVTAFTIAHSITLLLAATGIIRLPGTWVEVGIALTICYVAIENIVVKTSRFRWLLTFAFGLIHGIGFAGALGEIGLPQSYFLGSLLIFNLGVEAGQLAIVVLVLPLLVRLQRFGWYGKAVIIGGSVLIFVLAAKWALERAGLL
ncbi:HupE/UreJ family protein [Paenibacillus allorhizosphaerae]|uniref:HupE/UreJ family protein n=1 Tax=Paenibacillus allorhizosphaerae TaxID=2849866 RepID=UPI001C404448|nr:HupE/UreJ family protein [Paenibacillus allorhizosphaerae]